MCRTRSVPPFLVWPTRLTLVLIALLSLLLPHPLKGQKLRSRKLAAVPTETLETFDYKPSRREGSSLLRRLPRVRQWVEESIEEALAERGVSRAAVESPDFYILLWAESREGSRKLDSSQVSIGYVEQFLEGELVLEFVRGSDAEPFWQGTATDRVGFTRDGPKITWEKAEKKVRKATRGLIRRFFKDSRE